MVGVDEVGMGALCAPVMAAAVLVRPNCRKIAGVRDSKTLSLRQREALVAEIQRRSLAWGVGAASVSEMERLNIYHASHLAMRRALPFLLLLLTSSERRPSGSARRGARRACRASRRRVGRRSHRRCARP